MENTLLVSSPNVSGNVGSCEVKSVSFEKDSFHTMTVATNSCTGQIISQNVYFDWSIVYFPFCFVFAILVLNLFFVNFKKSY